MVRKVQVFTNDMGQEISIPEEDITLINSNPNYDVLQARHNPSGQVLTKVVTEPVRRNVGMQSFDPMNLNKRRKVFQNQTR